MTEVTLKSVSLEVGLPEEKLCFHITCAHAVTVVQIHPDLKQGQQSLSKEGDASKQVPLCRG